ncbi:hypothetical protein SDC9_176081 [bioreactor metagenome]|uniref:Uncharacterized protein n=1 Tax=bioreactor metagenome TaxID=1076179 RepID=A0A645GNZ1_9ZZZZ
MRLSQIDHEDGHALAFLLHFGQRRGARQQDHEVAVLDAADPDLLTVDHIAPVLLHGAGLDLGGVRARGGLCDTHGLQPPFARGDARQVFLLLRLRAMAQQRAHVVHLAVTGARVAATAVDLLHDDAGLGQAQAAATVLLRNQRGQPAGLGQRVHKGLGIDALLVDLAEILVGKLRTQRADGIADLVVVIGAGVFYHFKPF